MNENITLDKVSISFPHQQGTVVYSISTVFPGRTVTAIIGESGSGKSLLGKSIIALNREATVTGRFFWGVHELSQREQEMLRGEYIFYIPQDPATALNPTMTIYEQFVDLFYFHKLDCSLISMDKQINDVLENYRLKDVALILKSYPFQLSGGMQQRVICAMANILKPRWIIADEPTKGLDAIARQQMVRIFKNLQIELNCGMILITHDLQVAQMLSEHMVIMESGYIREEGLTSQCIANPKSQYLKNLLLFSPYRWREYIDE